MNERISTERSTCTSIVHSFQTKKKPKNENKKTLSLTGARVNVSRYHPDLLTPHGINLAKCCFTVSPRRDSIYHVAPCRYFPSRDLIGRTREGQRFNNTHSL